MTRLVDALMVCAIFVFLCVGWAWERVTGRSLMD